ncbi:hypothetical protein C0585_03625 [Candidatus Woesearchaeota archaeon]|nr:MAG: hypothetical protein C0585_03625 [Candidatus Woesearchaeota archaeon]
MKLRNPLTAIAICTLVAGCATATRPSIDTTPETKTVEYSMQDLRSLVMNHPEYSQTDAPLCSVGEIPLVSTEGFPYDRLTLNTCGKAIYLDGDKNPVLVDSSMVQGLATRVKDSYGKE